MLTHLVAKHGRSPHLHPWKSPALSWTFAAAIVAIALNNASAQTTNVPPPPAPAWPGIEVLAKPYLWVPWTSIDARPANPRIPSTSSTIDPGKLFSHLTWVSFMGEVEFRSGPFGLITDYIHAPLKSVVSAPATFSLTALWAE